MENVPRGDAPGKWHHVMNRGLAHRAAFEDRQDVRYFLSRIVHKVREGEIELHAYALLTTHFHLLVRSPRGRLSQAMMWIENQYVRWFNRRRGRDGPLFKGRFVSRHVDSRVYWHVLLRYIDHNPVQAGLVRRASSYPYCSATHYLHEHGPIWLSREVIEEHVRKLSGERSYRPESYVSLLGGDCREEERWIVERRTLDRGFDHRATDPFDDLVNAASDEVRRWLQGRARIGDGCDLGAPIAEPQSVRRELDLRRHARPIWNLATEGNRSISAWVTLAAGLLRHACGLSFSEIARRLEVSHSSATRAVAWHARFIETDSMYASTATSVLSAVLSEVVASARTARRA